MTLYWRIQQPLVSQPPMYVAYDLIHPIHSPILVMCPNRKTQRFMGCELTGKVSDIIRARA